MEKLRKKGLDIQPVEIEGRKIARTFWGEAWCDHIESFSDYENRLPRGRAYVRNGSVCHLDIAKGEVNAMVSGSELYEVKVAIKTLARKKWIDVKNRCAGQIGSLLELLQGRLSKNVMTVVTDRNKGLFPLPREISLKCNCRSFMKEVKHSVIYDSPQRRRERRVRLGALHGAAVPSVAPAISIVQGSDREPTLEPGNRQFKLWVLLHESRFTPFLRSGRQ